VVVFYSLHLHHRNKHLEIMKKSEIKTAILEKISVMEQNTFLFPKSWSNTIEMINEDWSYRTYNAERYGSDRYHNIEIFILNKKVLDINFRGNSIEVVQDLDKSPVTLKNILEYVTKIYEELHSFKNHKEGKRKIRTEINQAQLSIKKLEEEIKSLKIQLTDADKVI